MSDNESHDRFFFPSKLVFIDAASLTARLTGEYERRREKKKKDANWGFYCQTTL